MKQVFLVVFLVHSICNAQWERVQDIPGTRTVYTLLTAHDTLYAGTDSLVYVGADSGTLWSSGTPPVPSPDAVSCLMKYNNVLFAGTFQHGIYKSTNEGLSWQSFSSGLSGLGALDISALLVRRDSLIAGTLGEGVFITSSDLSHTWSPWGDSITSYQGHNVYKMAISGTTVMADAGANGYIFRYNDARPWWDPIPINSPPLVGQSVFALSSGAATVVAGTNSGIYRSINEGLSWEPTSPSIPPSTIAILLVQHQSAFFALIITTTTTSLLRSTDEGQHWGSLGAFSMPYVYDIAIVGDTFYLGRVDGLWKAPLSVLVTSVAGMESELSRYKLEQCYPNPFNASTGFSYQLAVRSRVDLRVYDLLGREVAVLENDERPAGVHTATWDAGNKASGIYFYRLVAGSFTSTRRMILLR